MAGGSKSAIDRISFRGDVNCRVQELDGMLGDADVVINSLGIATKLKLPGQGCGESPLPSPPMPIIAANDGLQQFPRAIR